MQINKPTSKLDILNQMLESDGNDGSLFEQFKNYDNLEDVLRNGDFTEEENKLAQIYYKWINNNDEIYVIWVEDSEPISNISLPKPYKKIITYGLGYNDVRIILHNF